VKPTWPTTKQQLKTLTKKLITTITTLKNINKYTALTIIVALTYGTIFSYFTILRNATFYSAGWDLGNFNQAFYNTIFERKTFYYTADMYFSPSGSLFAIHTSPILFLILPLYAIAPSPNTLLIIKSYAIGIAAIPLFLLTRKLLENDKAAFLITLAYLLYSPLQGANWFDFQQSAFFALFAFSAYFFLLNKNWKLYFPTMLLALMVEEHMAIVMAILAIYYFTIHAHIKTLLTSLKHLTMNEDTAPILTIIICIIYLFTAISIKSLFPVNPNFAEIYKASANFRTLGSSDLLSLPIYVLLNPQRVIDALSYDFVHKFFYLIFLFSPLLFIPVRNRFALGIAFILMPFVLSNYSPYYTLGIHYAFYIIPLIFIATIYGVRSFEPKSRIFTLKTILLVTLLFALCTSPLSPISQVFVQQNVAYYSPIEFSLDENKQSLNDLLSLLPSDASILTQNQIFPHVSNRLNAYIIPFSDYGKPDEMQEYVNQLLNKSDYVLLDIDSMSSIDRIALNRITEDNTYGPYALGKSTILFKRGFTGDPTNAYYTTNQTFLAYRDMLLSPLGSVIDDLSSRSGKVFLYPKGASDCSSYGPYIYLLQGAYEVTFTVKIGDHNAGSLGTFDVATDVGTRILSSRDVYGFEFKTDEWTNITLPFSLPKLKTEIEFRFFNDGAAEALLDYVTVKRISSIATAGSNVTTLRVAYLTLRSGYVNAEGFLFHQHGTIDEAFWFGPNWDFSPGNYTATFLMKISPMPNTQGQHVLDLSITGRTGEAVEPVLVDKMSLYTQDFIANGNVSDWQSLKLDFTIKRSMIDVEFKGLLPTPNYDLYLASIIIERRDVQ
jgi:uncharacterized membrane protein